MRRSVAIAPDGADDHGFGLQAGLWPAENMANADQSLAAENIVSNDVTAIDAVTGDASNMAADVNYTAEINVENATGNIKMPVMPTPRKPAPGKPPLETPTPAGSVNNNAM